MLKHYEYIFIQNFILFFPFLYTHKITGILIFSFILYPKMIIKKETEISKKNSKIILNKIYLNLFTLNLYFKMRIKNFILNYRVYIGSK